MAEPGQELIWGNCIRCNFNVDFPKISSRKKKKHFIGNAIMDFSLPKLKKKKQKQL